MAVTYQIDKVERQGNLFPGIGGDWYVYAHGPSSNVAPGQGVYADDGVILDVKSVTPRQGGDVDIVAVKTASQLSLAVSPKGWKTLTGGPGAQPSTPSNIGSLLGNSPSSSGIISDIWDAIPTWAKVTGAIVIGFEGLHLVAGLRSDAREFYAGAKVHR